MPAESRAARLVAGKDSLAVETLQGAWLSAFDGVSKLGAPANLKVSPGQAFADEPNLLRVSRGRTQLVNLKMPFPVAETELLGTLAGGDFFVYVIGLAGSDELLLDHLVLRFDAAGRLKGQARVPAQERLFAVPNGTALAADGGVYSLVTREGGVDIVRLNFYDSLPALRGGAKARPQVEAAEAEAEAPASAAYTVGAGESINFKLDSGRSAANAGQLTRRKWSINGTVIGTQAAMSYTLGPGTHKVSLELENSDGGTAGASLTIRIDRVIVVPQHTVSRITPTSVRRGAGTWLKVEGARFQKGLRVQVRSRYGGPFVIASSGVSYVNSGLVRVYVVMGGSGTYTATLEVVQNGLTASRTFTVK